MDQMNKKTKTIAFRIIGLMLGALVDYCYLVLIGRVNFNNTVFLVFFAGAFAVLMTELVATFKILDIDRFAIFASADERMVPENKLGSHQTMWMALLFLAATILFQSNA